MQFFLCFFLCLQSVFSFSQSTGASNPFEQKAFVENKGQFDHKNGKSSSEISFGASCEGVELYFTSGGLTYRHDEYPVISKEERERIEEGKADRSVNLQPVSHFLHITWEGSNPNVQIIPGEVVSYYYTYPDQNDISGKTSLKAPAFKKITYKDLYPNIDVEYIFPEGKGGIKYSLILHPGADSSQIKMKYEGAKRIFPDPSGNIVIQSAFGEFIDHAPQTFYKESGKAIPSSFIVKNNIVSFSLRQLEISSLKHETIVIDPWVTNPVFPGFNSAYDVEYDYAGNVYVYGGACPYIEIKLNSAGAIQWIYTATLFTFIGYYGDFCVDPNSGSSYVCEGVYWPFTPGGSRVAKVNASGTQVAMFPTGNVMMKEAWRTVFDNCNKKIIIAGSSFNNPAPGYYQGFILDTNCVNLTSVNVLSGTTFFLNEQDMCMLALDNSNNCFMGDCGNKILKVPAATLAPTAYVLPNNHSFNELTSIEYVRNTNPSTCAMNAMAVSNKYLYTYDGGLLQRWNKNTGAFMNGTTLSATKFRWGGIAVDECDNIFVGYQASVVQYDTNFAVVATFPGSVVTDTVYDVRLAPGNFLYACGRGFVSSSQLTLASCSSFSVTATGIGSCSGQGSATVTVTGGAAPFTYVWNPTGQTTATATGLIAGTYTVTVSDNTFCAPKVQTTTVTITGSGSTLAVATSQNNLLCNGGGNGDATVTPGGGTSPYTYNWSPSGGSTSAASGLSAGTYTALVTDASGCMIPQIITITEPSAIIVTANSTSTTCTSNSGTASVIASGGTPGYSYSWSNGQTTSATTGLAAGNYAAIITDANGCTRTQTVTITSAGGFILSTLSTQTGCTINNGTATAMPNGGTAPYTYNWNNGNTTSQISGLAAQNYSVIVTDASGCTQSQTVSVTQTPGPTVSATASSATVTVGSSATLTASGGGTYLWSPVTGLSCNTCANPMATPQQTISYCVLVTDANNCSDSACVTIYVDIPCGNIYIPNAFSPNSDQENDWECVFGNCIESLLIIIYNRWGEIVFESSDQKKCWDGTYKGEPLNAAVFTYYLEATLKSGEKINKKGNISLIR